MRLSRRLVAAFGWRADSDPSAGSKQANNVLDGVKSGCEGEAGESSGSRSGVGMAAESKGFHEKGIGGERGIRTRHDLRITSY